MILQIARRQLPFVFVLGCFAAIQIQARGQSAVSEPFRNPGFTIDRIVEEANIHQGDISFQNRIGKVDGTVRGSILCINGIVDLGPKGVVTGDIILVGDSKLIKTDGAVIKGQTKHFQAPTTSGGTEDVETSSSV